MKKICQNCSNTFEVSASDKNFYETIAVPEPTLCVQCRHLRRHGFINDYTFFSRKCDSCTQNFISIFPQNSEYTVYCQECWYAEERDDTREGREYDFSRSFFEQFDELLHAAPQLGIIGQNNENCSYCESVANSKNCYLISESSNCEDCLYAYWIQKTRDCLDVAYTHECERCYELVDCHHCYHLLYSQNCRQCSDSFFLEGCRNCRDCFFCTNLVNKQYCIANTQYSEAEYFQKMQEFALHEITTVRDLQEKFIHFLQTHPRKYLQIENAYNCSGNYISNAKNCHGVFHCYDAEDCTYGEHVWRGAKNCMDVNTVGRNTELIYESTNSGINSYNVKFSRYCWGCSDTEYSNSCKQGSYLFGCSSLKPGARYRILNKQYAAEDYHVLVQQIKAQMLQQREYGEFFPLTISLFGYNTTVSFDESPLPKEEVLQKGWKWEEALSGQYGGETIRGEDIPVIADVDKSILSEILCCQQCAKNYRITETELDFYIQNKIPIPTRCFFCRQKRRLALRSPKKLWQRTCSRCASEMWSSYAPDQPEEVLCEACYLAAVY